MARYWRLAVVVAFCATAVLVILMITQGGNPRARIVIGIPLGVILFLSWGAWQGPRRASKARTQLNSTVQWNGSALLRLADGSFAQTLQPGFWTPTMIGGWCYVDATTFTFVPSERLAKNGARTISIPLDELQGIVSEARREVTGNAVLRVTISTSAGRLVLDVIEPAGVLPSVPSSRGV